MPRLPAREKRHDQGTSPAPLQAKTHGRTVAAGPGAGHHKPRRALPVRRRTARPCRGNGRLPYTCTVLRPACARCTAASCQARPRELNSDFNFLGRMMVGAGPARPRLPVPVHERGGPAASQSRSPALLPGGQSSSAAVATSSAAAGSPSASRAAASSRWTPSSALRLPVAADPVRGLRGGHPLHQPAPPARGDASASSSRTAAMACRSRTARAVTCSASRGNLDRSPGYLRAAYLGRAR